MFSDEQLDELLGAYALDAVDEDERVEVEKYLDRSASARDEVHRHYEVAMALATSPGIAPPALWNRIEASTASGGLHAQPNPPIALHRPRRPKAYTSGSTGSVSSRIPAARWAMPVAAAALVAVVSTVAIRQNQTIRNLRTDVSAAQASARSSQARATKVERLLASSNEKERVIQQLLSTSGTTIAHLDTPTGVSVVDVILSPDGQGYLVSKALPALSSGRTYQLWGVADGVVLSLGVFGAAPKTLEFAAHEHWTKFVLTEEQSPGVPTSSQPAMAAGDVKSI